MRKIGAAYTSSPACDLVQLRYVRAVVASSSLTAAAEQLRVSQPTLSAAIRGLEKRLGTTLFLRNPRGMVPTASGKILARAADEVGALLRRAEEQIRGVESAAVGQFVIGCYHSVGAIFLPGLTTGVAARAPAIELSFWEGVGPRVIEAVVDRTVHFGLDIDSLVPRRHPDLVRVPLFRDVVGIVCARRRPPATAPLFHVPRVRSSAKIVEALQARGLLPERVVPCGDLELVKSLVQSGAGLGVLPWRLAIQGTTRGALRLADPKLPFEVDIGSLYYRADLHRTRAALLVREELIRRGRELDRVPMPCGIAPLKGAQAGIFSPSGIVAGR
jgi:DNA-binding transcriptional LysR family regulator